MLFCGVAYDIVRIKLSYLIKVCAYGETLFSTLHSHQKLKIAFRDADFSDLNDLNNDDTEFAKINNYESKNVF